MAQDLLPPPPEKVPTFPPVPGRPAGAVPVQEPAPAPPEELAEPTPDEMLEALHRMRPRTVGEKLQDAWAGGMGSFVESFALTADTLAILGSATDRWADPETSPEEQAEAGTEIGNAIRDLKRFVALPPTEKLEHGFSDDLAAGLGSAAALVGPGALGKALGLSSRLVVSQLGGAQTAASLYWEAKAAGASEEQAWKALAAGYGAGQFEALGIGGVLARADQRSGGTLRRILTLAPRIGLEEGAQEAATQIAQNAIASHLVAYEPDRKLLEGVGTAFGVGALTGFLFESTQIAGKALARAPQAAPQPGAPGAPQPAAGAVPAGAAAVVGGAPIAPGAAGGAVSLGDLPTPLGDTARIAPSPTLKSFGPPPEELGQDAAPPPAAAPPPGVPRFRSQEEVDIEEADLPAQGPDFERGYRRALEQTGAYAPEEVTGWQQKQHRIPTARRAAAWVGETGQSAVYGEIDLRNLGGLNARFGHQGANVHFRAMTDIVREELLAVAPDAQLFRHGGDEVSVIAAGHGEAEISQALQRAKDRVDEYARANGLDKLPAPKVDEKTGKQREPGVGVSFGVARIRAGEDPAEFFSRADQRTEAAKKEPTNVQREATGTPGVVPPEGTGAATGAGSTGGPGRPGRGEGPAGVPAPPGGEPAGAPAARGDRAEAGRGEVAAEPAAAPPPIAHTPAEPALPTPEPETTGVKNRVVDRELREMGMDPAEHGESTTFRAEHEKAKAKLDADPFAGKRLVDELEDAERATTPEEGALLALELNRLINERDAAEEAYIADPTEANFERVGRAKRDYGRAADVVTKAGTKSGQSLAFRKMMVARDYSLAAMERRAQVANGGKELTAEQSAEVKRLHDKLKEAEAAHELYVQEAEARATELAEENAALRSKRRVRAQKRAAEITKTKKRIETLFEQLARHSSGQANIGLDPRSVKLVSLLAYEHIKLGVQTFTQFADLVVARLGERIRPALQAGWDEAQKKHTGETLDKIKKGLGEGRSLPQMRRHVGALAKQFVQSGVTDRDALIDAVHAELVKIDPKITRRQAMDLISGYGDFRALTKEEADVRLRDLRGQMQQVAKLEDMLAKKPPKKTGQERRTPSDEERRLIQQVNEAKKRLGITRIAPENALKSALDSIKTRLKNQIKDLEHQIQTGTPIVREKGAAPSDAEVEALRKQRDALKEQYDELIGKAVSDEARLQAATKAVEKSIADYERRIAEGDLAAKKRAEGPTSPELVALRARRDALREELEALRDAAKPKRSPEERALQSLKTRMANELARLEERNFYGRRGAVYEKTKKPPLVLDKEALRLKADIEEARAEYLRLVERHRLANRTKAEKAVDAAKEVLALPRAIKSSWDFSAVLRQGAFFTLGHPIETIRTHLPRMFRAAFSERAFREIDIEIRERPLAEFARQSGLDLTTIDETLAKGEEAIRSQLSDRLPGMRASNRAFVAFLNSQRAAAFDAMVQAIPETPTKAEGKAIAALVNVATGRGDVGKAAGAMSTLANILWSPRLMISRFQLLSGQPLTKGSARTRKLAAKEYGRFLVGLAAVYAMARLLDADIEEDPRSSDFGKIRFGTTRLDPLAGLSQTSVLVARLGSGETKTIKGDVNPIRGKVPYGRDTSADVIARFLRTKLTPLLGTAIDIASGENVVGEPVTLESTLADVALPLTFSDLKDALESRGVPAGSALAMLSIFGWGLQDFPTVPRSDEPEPKKPVEARR